MTFGRLTTILTLALSALAPIWMLPLSPNPLSFQKEYLFALYALVLFILWTIQTLRWRKVLFSLTLENTASLLLMTAALISAGFAPNPYFQVSGRVILLSAMAFTLIFGTTLHSDISWKRILRVFLWLGALLSLVSWLQLTPWPISGLLNKVLLTNFPSGLPFTLAESPLALLAFLIPVSVAGLLAHSEIEAAPVKNKVLRLLSMPIFWSGVILATIGLFAVTFLRTPSLRPIVLPLQFGWEIAVDNFKSPHALLIGVGPESFLIAFHRLRDVSYNMTPLWATRFSASTTEFLHTLTTLGLLGTVAWMGVLIAALLQAKQIWKHHKSLSVFLVLQVISFFLIPWTVLSFIVLTILMLAAAQELRRAHPEHVRDVVILLSAIRIVPHGEVKSLKSHSPFAVAVAVILSIIVGIATYGAGRAYAAQALYTLSLYAAQRNQVTTSYKRQQQAIGMNPTSSALHRAYASTNIAIARSVAQKTDLTEDERKLFAQLLQQSIRESRAAAQLLPAETENWETLATIYSNLLNVEGAQQWATAGLVQAIQTDPVSPQLRVSLGGLYLNLNQPDQAQRLFEQAIQLKPDWDIAYASYGKALGAQNQWSVAVQAYEKALQLAKPTDEEYPLIQNLLDDAKTKAAQAPAATPTPNALPKSNTPTVPEKPKAEKQPDGFNNILQGKAADPTPAPAATPTPAASNQNGANNNLVLPQNVGF